MINTHNYARSTGQYAANRNIRTANSSANKLAFEGTSLNLPAVVVITALTAATFKQCGADKMVDNIKQAKMHGDTICIPNYRVLGENDTLKFLVKNSGRFLQEIPKK